MSRRRALFPRDVFLRSVTSWYHSSNRSRSEFVRQLTAAFGISWSKKNAGASWFLVQGQAPTQYAKQLALCGALQFVSGDRLRAEITVR